MQPKFCSLDLVFFGKTILYLVILRNTFIN